MMELLYTQHNTTFSLLLQQGMENNDQQQRNQNNERKQGMKTKTNDLQKAPNCQISRSFSRHDVRVFKYFRDSLCVTLALGS